jgi:hypothetical protein
MPIFDNSCFSKLPYNLSSHAYLDTGRESVIILTTNELVATAKHHFHVFVGLPFDSPINTK